MTLRDLVTTRIAALRRLAADAASRAALEDDLAAFGLRLRRARTRSRWEEEEPAVPVSCTLAPALRDEEPF